MHITPSAVESWKNQTLSGHITWTRFKGQMCCIAQFKAGGIVICKYINAANEEEVLLGILKENQSLDHEFIIKNDHELFQPLASLYDVVYTEYCQVEPEFVLDF